jgi:hypothetical protein
MTYEWSGRMMFIVARAAAWNGVGGDDAAMLG